MEEGKEARGGFSNLGAAAGVRWSLHAQKYDHSYLCTHSEGQPPGGGRARSLYATLPSPPPPPRVLRDSGLGAWR